MTLGSCATDRTPDLGGAGEGYFVDIGMFHQRLAGGTIAGHDVDHSRG